jgi:predicted amidohydrolase YtcJ
MGSPDLVLHRGLFTTLDRGNPTVSAVAIKDGVFTAVGHDHEVMKLAGPSTKVIDLKGKRVLPGLIDNHLHIIRGGLNFNMELQQCGCANSCSVHGHDHARAWSGRIPASDLKSFWGALGCWAV